MCPLFKTPVFKLKKVRYLKHFTGCIFFFPQLCAQVSPVSLYLGEGKVDLPEVDKDTIVLPKLNSPERSMSDTPKVLQTLT